MVAADVGMGAGALQQLAQGLALLQHFARPVPALSYGQQRQVAKHQPQPGRLGLGAAQLALGPGHLFGGQGGRGGIPHQQEKVVLTHAVSEGKAAGINKLQPQGILLAAPITLGLLAIELKYVVAPRTGGRGVVVAHGDRHRQPSPLQRCQQLAMEGGPHGAEVYPAEALLLARHHVAAAEHQIGFPAGDQFNGPQHLRQVAGGAVAAVEIADRHQAQVAPGRQQRLGTSPRGGSRLRAQA